MSQKMLNRIVVWNLNGTPEMDEPKKKFKNRMWVSQLALNIVCIFIILMLVLILLHYQSIIYDLRSENHRHIQRGHSSHQENHKCPPASSNQPSTSTQTTLITTTTQNNTNDLQLLLVATGVFGSDYISSVELLNLDANNEDYFCDQLQDFPAGFNGAVGAILNKNFPIICGACRCYTLFNSTWIRTSNTTDCRYYASAVVQTINTEQLILTGGNYNNILNSVEVFNFSSWQHGVFEDMPFPIYEHCLVALNDTTLMSIGGINFTYGVGGKSTNRTALFRLDLNKWFPGPDLNVPRFGHSCGALPWTPLGTAASERVIVVAGGFNAVNGNLASVELLFPKKNQTLKWKFGPSLPRAIYGSAMVEYKSSVVLIGGSGDVEESRHLYQLESIEATYWEEMPQHLTNGRSGHVAFVVPENLVNCYKMK